jgi:hypothetical protein
MNAIKHPTHIIFDGEIPLKITDYFYDRFPSTSLIFLEVSPAFNERKSRVNKLKPR